MNTEQTPETQLILASASPRRRELMAEAGYDFRVIDPPFDEPDQMGPEVPPTHQAEALSYFKARAVAGQVETGVVVAADTVVACGGQVFGKPVDVDDAARILAALLGRRQEVITGVTILDAATNQRLIAHDTTIVWMRTLPPETVERYLATQAWVGKAGAYGIQDRADAFVERIEGSFTNVVGLPMELLRSMLSQWGYLPPAPLTKQAPT
jgi:septum formation protein